jgi:hypothetical protein
MNSELALHEIGADDNELSPRQRAALDRDGFFIVEGVDAPECREMAEEFDRMSALEGARSGSEVDVELGARQLTQRDYLTEPLYERMIPA